MYICTYVRTYVCTYVRTYVRMYVHMYILRMYIVRMYEYIRHEHWTLTSRLFRELWHDAKFRQQTGKKTDQPTDQRTDMRAYREVTLTINTLGPPIYMYVYPAAVTISLICLVTKIFHPDEEKLQISPPVCPSHVCHLWVRVLCVLINWWHTRMIIAKFQILCNFSFAYFRF